MSDQAPAAFGGTKGKGEWKDLQDFLKNPKDVAGTQAQAGGRRGQGVQELTRDGHSGSGGRGRRSRPADPASRRQPRTRHAGACTGTRWCGRGAFLLPALLLLGALVVYPIVLLGLPQPLRRRPAPASSGLDNYRRHLHRRHHPDRRHEQRDLGASSRPPLATALGLIFAVLTERIRWGTAFKLIVFMPMAISMLAAGIIFRLVYEQDPEQGVANAVVGGRARHLRGLLRLPEARPRPASDLQGVRRRLVHHHDGTVRPGDPVDLPLVGVAADEAARRRASPPRRPTPSGRGHHRHGLAGLHQGRRRQASGRSTRSEKALHGDQGRGGEGRQGGRHGDQPAPTARSRLPADGRRRPTAAAGARTSPAPYNGIDWLGPSLVTPAIIGSYVWMWAGFAMVLIAAGLAGAAA